MNYRDLKSLVQNRPEWLFTREQHDKLSEHKYKSWVARQNEEHEEMKRTLRERNS